MFNSPVRYIQSRSPLHKSSKAAFKEVFCPQSQQFGEAKVAQIPRGSRVAPESPAWKHCLGGAGPGEPAGGARTQAARPPRPPTHLTPAKVAPQLQSRAAKGKSTHTALQQQPLHSPLPGQRPSTSACVSPGAGAAEAQKTPDRVFHWHFLASDVKRMPRTSRG